jgi:hypothetical protein
VQSASIVSVLALPLSLLSTSESARPLDSIAYAPLSLTLLISLLTQVALLAVLYLSESASTAASTLFPRNLVLLVWSTFGREGIPLRENWMQVVLVYGVGSVALLWTDSDVLNGFKELRSGGEGSTFLPLDASGHPSNSPTFSSLRPPSPPPNLRKSSDHNLPPSSSSSRLPPILTLIPFLPLLIYLITSPATTSSLSSACLYLPPSLRSSVCPTSTSQPKSRTVDIVMSFVLFLLLPSLVGH